MLKQSEIDKLRVEIDTLNHKREFLELDSVSWKRNKNKADKLFKQLVALKTELRTQPLMRTIGVEVFHVLTKSDLEKIWEVTGVKRPLMRCNTMPTAKFSFKRSDKIIVYLDVRPAGIFYSTKK